MMRNCKSFLFYVHKCVSSWDCLCLFKPHHIFTHIHMHPDVVLFADVRNGNEGVKGSIHCCSGCCAYKEWYKALQGWRRKTAADTLTQMCFWIFLIVISISHAFLAVCATFCLASSILLSRSAGIILPLQKKENASWDSILMLHLKSQRLSAKFKAFTLSRSIFWCIVYGLWMWKGLLSV